MISPGPSAVDLTYRCCSRHQKSLSSESPRHTTREIDLDGLQNVTRDGVSNGSNASPPALHLHCRRSPQRFPYWIVGVEPRSHGLETRSAPHRWKSQPDAGTPEVGHHTTPYRREENVTDAPRDCVLGPRTFHQATN
jgi:hypothetical protein